MDMVRRLRRGLAKRLGTDSPKFDYVQQYADQAATNQADEVIGCGSYQLMGQIELDLLRMAGLTPSATLVDLGCGNGRLAVHAVPFLSTGAYHGVDLCLPFLNKAEERVAMLAPPPSCKVRWHHSDSPELPLEMGSVDLYCAFSVFTHMEHEDTFRYLQAARRRVKHGGKFVASCLTFDLPLAKEMFLAEAHVELQTRWSRVRNVVTTVELMEGIATLAGWNVERWIPGNDSIITQDGRPPRALGQSCMILVNP